MMLSYRVDTHERFSPLLRLSKDLEENLFKVFFILLVDSIFVIGSFILFVGALLLLDVTHILNLIGEELGKLGILIAASPTVDTSAIKFGLEKTAKALLDLFMFWLFVISSLATDFLPVMQSGLVITFTLYQTTLVYTKEYISSLYSLWVPWKSELQRCSSVCTGKYSHFEIKYKEDNDDDNLHKSLPQIPTSDRDKTRGNPSTHLTIKVTMNDTSMWFKMNTTQPLKKLMTRFCREHKISSEDIQFLFKNSLVYPTNSPEKIGMVEDDCLEVRWVDTLSALPPTSGHVVPVCVARMNGMI